MGTTCHLHGTTRKPHLLVVDDEGNIRHTLRRWFEYAGFRVDVAEDGDVAVRLCEESPYDLVTMDLDMPRMNGRDALAAIRKEKPSLPVIILTGYLDHMNDPRLMTASSILVKPVSLRILETEVRRLINA